MLDLVEHEARDHERAEQEARLHDLGDPAVDDGAAVDDDVRVTALAGRLRVRPADQSECLRGNEQVLSLGDRQADHSQAEKEGDPDRHPRSERVREGCQRRPEEQPHEEAEEEADHGGDELRRGQRLNAAHDAQRRDDRQVRKHGEPENGPRDQPGHDDRPGAGHLAEARGVGRHDDDTDEPAEGGAQHADRPDHRRSA